MNCSIDECQRPVASKGMCGMHYARVRRNGHPRLVRRTCDDCSTVFLYESEKGRRRFLCDTCVARRRQERIVRHNHRQSKARAGDEPEYPLRLQEYRFRSNIRQYGITPEDYDDMLRAQDGRCAICGDPPAPDGKGAYSRLHIDHCHQTSTVRGLLCGRCNQGLGYFRDDPSRLTAAIAYLKETA